MMQTVFIKWALLGFMLCSMITLCASNATEAATTTAGAAVTTVASAKNLTASLSNYGHVSASLLIISFLMMVLVIII